MAQLEHHCAPPLLGRTENTVTPRRVLTGLSALLIVGLASACAAGHDGGSSANVKPAIAAMWRDQISQALADPALSDFERQVLSDEKITDAEYRDAQTRYVQCMADQGWTVTVDGSQYAVRGAPGSGNDYNTVSDATHQQCQIGSLKYIEPIYLGMRDNPQGLSGSEQIRACYEKHAVPDGKGLSNDEFAKLVSDPQYRASTPAGRVCRFDPTGAAGITEQTAADLEAQSSGEFPVVTPSPTSG